MGLEPDESTEYQRYGRIRAGGVAVKLRVLLCLSILAALTAVQVQTWHNDLSLWGAAVRWNTGSPRPLFNYAVAWRVAGDYERSAQWLERTAAVLPGHPREDDYRRAIRLQFTLIESTGHYVCDSAARQALCY